MEEVSELAQPITDAAWGASALSLAYDENFVSEPGGEFKMTRFAHGIACEVVRARARAEKWEEVLVKQ